MSPPFFAIANLNELESPCIRSQETKAMLCVVSFLTMPTQTRTSSYVMVSSLLGCDIVTEGAQSKTFFPLDTTMLQRQD